MEVQVLVSWYGLATLEDLQKILKRPRGSIVSKAYRCGLTQPNRRSGVASIRIPGLGDVKIDGQFQRQALEAFLRSRFLQTNETLAQALHCSPTTIARWRKKLGLEIYHQSHVRRRTQSPQTGTFRTLLRRSRFDAQEAIITRAVDHFSVDGNLPGFDNAKQTLGVVWSKATGTGHYRSQNTQRGRPEGNLRHHRIFDNPAEFWIAFDAEVSLRLAALISEGKTETPRFSHLLMFNPFAIRFESEYLALPRLGALFDKYRPQEQAKLISEAVDRFSRSGTYPNHLNAQTTLGMGWEKATGTARYRLGNVQKQELSGNCVHQRVFDSTIDFWAAFSSEVLKRLEALGTIVGPPHAAHRRLVDFSPFQLKLVEGPLLRDPRFLALYDAHRPREQRKLIERAVDHFQHTGVLPTTRNAMTTLGTKWDRVMGANKYAVNNPVLGISAGRASHQRIFDSTLDFWIAFAAEVSQRVTQLQNRSRIETEAYRNLKTFSPFLIEQWDRAYVFSTRFHDLFDGYRPQEQQRLVAFAVDRFAQTGQLPSQKTTRETLNMSWQKATGTSQYRPDNPRSSHRRIFDSRSDFFDAFTQQAIAVLHDLVVDQGIQLSDPRVQNLIGYLKQRRGVDTDVLNQLYQIQCKR